MYGVFYATSFLELYRSPQQVSTPSLSLTVMVDSDEQYLFLVSPLSITAAAPDCKRKCPGAGNDSAARSCSAPQVRAIAPFLGPPSEYAMVKMIPNERLPPRNLHRVRADKTQATLKWQPPYDSPNTPLVLSCMALPWRWRPVDVSGQKKAEPAELVLSFYVY